MSFYPLGRATSTMIPVLSCELLVCVCDYALLGGVFNVYVFAAVAVVAVL